MALIKCKECGKEISDQATSCPACGCPITATTIEKTAKLWKGAQLISLLVSIIGFITMGISCQYAITEKGAAMGEFGVYMFLLGIASFILTKIAAWWHHG